jgi:predicted nuclease of predicted toxin-antitoxin system
VKLLADECCEASLVQALRDDGHDVLYGAETLRRLSDIDVLHRSVAEQRLLLTEDKDFGELVFRLRRSGYGVILLRFAEEEQAAKIDRLRHVLADRPERLSGAFVVLEIDKTRIRPLQSES